MQKRLETAWRWRGPLGRWSPYCAGELHGEISKFTCDLLLASASGSPLEPMLCCENNAFDEMREQREVSVDGSARGTPSDSTERKISKNMHADGGNPRSGYREQFTLYCHSAACLYGSGRRGKKLQVVGEIPGNKHIHAKLCERGTILFRVLDATGCIEAY